MVSRIAVLGLILLTASACSRMPNVPTAYSSLPALTVEHEAGPKVVPSPAVPEAALPVIRIPGTALAHGTEENQGPRVNPLDVLATSTRARLAWQTLHPTVLARPSSVASSRAGGQVAETGAIGGKSAVPAETRSYNREAMMRSLEKEGKRAARPICSGC